MPPKSSNPDPISDPKRHFLHSIVSQGEEYLPTLWDGVCRPSLQILTPFQTPRDISYTLLLVRGKSTYLHFGWGVPPKSSNPDPISDPKRHFLHSTVSQGEEYLPALWVEVCRPSLQILTPFQTPKDISYTLLLARGRSTYLHFGWRCAAQVFKS